MTVAVGIAENILYYCTPTDISLYKCMLGVNLTANVTGLVIDDNGHPVKVELVEIGELTSACITGDLLKVGDVINSITIDGESRQVSRIHHVIDFMYRARVGSTVILDITRGEERLSVTITVTESSLTKIK